MQKILGFRRNNDPLLSPLLYLMKLYILLSLFRMHEFMILCNDKRRQRCINFQSTFDNISKLTHFLQLQNYQMCRRDWNLINQPINELRTNEHTELYIVFESY